MKFVAVLAENRLHGEAWHALLQSESGIERIACANDLHGLEVLGAPDQDVALLVDMIDGRAEAVRWVSGVHAGWGALVLVQAYERQEITSLMRAGAVGVLTRDSTVGELVSGLVAVARGELVLPGSLTGEVLADILGTPSSDAEAPPVLSPREEEVLRLLARGQTNKSIAQDLLLSVRTVESHLRAIYAKLHVASRTEAVLWAVAHMNPHPG